MRSRFLILAGLFLLAGCAKEIKEAETSCPKPGVATRSALSGKQKTYVKYKAEYLTTGESGQMGQIVFFRNVGNKQLADDFVAFDPRRGGGGKITYAVDDETTSDNGLAAPAVKSAIEAAMATWDGVSCSNLGLDAVPYSGDLGVLSALIGAGGSFDVVADVQHSGFLPAAFFDFLAPSGSSFILAVTFTFIFIDQNGNPTDIDNDGRADVAFREIYYNDAFTWSNNAASGVDIETVALHEAGHGLSQAHFGKGFINISNGKVQIAPRAVMNAVYSGEQRTLLGTDKGGHCSNWASWPNN